MIRLKAFPLQRIRDTPGYLPDERLITLEDVVEFFNLVTEAKLNVQE